MRSHIVVPVFTLALFAVALTVAGQTPEGLVGTWKTNVAKSTYSPGPPPKPATSRMGACGRWPAQKHQRRSGCERSTHTRRDHGQV